FGDGRRRPGLGWRGDKLSFGHKKSPASFSGAGRVKVKVGYSFSRCSRRTQIGRSRSRQFTTVLTAARGTTAHSDHRQVPFVIACVGPLGFIGRRDPSGWIIPVNAWMEIAVSASGWSWTLTSGPPLRSLGSPPSTSPHPWLQGEWRRGNVRSSHRRRIPQTRRRVLSGAADIPDESSD